jgi:hypothetical protein
VIEYRAELALQLRISLLEVLAPASSCGRCGARHDLEDLEVDHVDGCTYDKRELAAWTRAARYWQEHDRGVRLRALCRSCNASDGTRRFRGRSRYR